MTWTYVLANVGTSDRSWVRMRVGDTSSGRQLLQDEEVDALLADAGDRVLAAANAARSIGASLAVRVDKTVGALSLSLAQASAAYDKLADTILRESGLHVAPYAGGISEGDKDAGEADGDRVTPQFRLGMDDFPGTGVASAQSSTDLTG